MEEVMVTPKALALLPSPGELHQDLEPDKHGPASLQQRRGGPGVQPGKIAISILSAFAIVYFNFRENSSSSG
jgi:hypothetical protein